MPRGLPRGTLCWVSKGVLNNPLVKGRAQCPALEVEHRATCGGCEFTLPVFYFLPAEGHNAVIVNSLLEKQSGKSGVKTNIRSMNPPKSTAEKGSV